MRSRVTVTAVTDAAGPLLEVANSVTVGELFQRYSTFVMQCFSLRDLGQLYGLNVASMQVCGASQ
jgi:hypothetical protein